MRYNQSVPSRLSLLALFFGAPMLLLGAVTNSWWSADEGRMNVSAGLTKIKICQGALNCQAVSYSLFDASMQQVTDSDGSVMLPGAAGEQQVAVGKSYAWAGSVVFWLSILGSLIVLVFYKTASGDDPWRPAAIAALIVVGTAAALALLFVVKKPNVIVRVMPLDFGYSFFMYVAGAAAVCYGLIVEGLKNRYLEDGPEQRWSPAAARTPSSDQPTKAAPSVGAGGSAQTPSGQACQSCGGAAVFRKDVGCLVCSQCGVLI